MKEKSKGHICFNDNFEFYQCGNQVYRAALSNVIDIEGYRFGRWECSVPMFNRFKDMILGRD